MSDTLPVSPWDLFIAVWTAIGMASAEELDDAQMADVREVSP